MSRSNGPGAPTNGWPADYRPEPADPYQDPYYTQPPQRPAPQQPVSRQPRIQTQPPASRVPQTGLPQGGLPPQNYGQNYGQAPAQQGYPQAGQYAPQQPQYAQPQAPQSYPPQAYAPQPPPAYAPPQQRAPQPSRPPQADARYGAYADYNAPTGRPTAPAHSAYPPPYSPPPAPPSAYVPENPTRPPQPQQRAGNYADQWAPSAPAADPQNFDLGAYAPDPRTQRPTAPPAWTPHAEPEPVHQGYQPAFPADLHVPSQALEPVEHDDEYDDEDEYEDAPRKTRYGLIAASLVAAIAAGGGLAYAYKVFIAPPAQLAATPLIKSGSGPIKVKPIDPGGTKFANTDSKMMEQLSGANSADQNSDGGPKTVKTMTIERDGSVASAQSDAPPPQRASGGVPGMIIAGLPPPQPAPAPPAAQAAPVTVQPPPQRATPKIITAAAPPPQAASPNEQVAAPVAPPAAKKPLAKKPPAVAPSAVGGPTGANGFVAVLASVPASATSRVQAMQQYADLQQKFGGVLGSKAPDVVEAKLGDKGTFHRLIVGPPASRDAAGSVCTQLKAAGYTADCWVTAF